MKTLIKIEVDSSKNVRKIKGYSETKQDKKFPCVILTYKKWFGGLQIINAAPVRLIDCKYCIEYLDDLGNILPE